MENEHDLADAWNKAKIERYNLAVLGATGVGKSSLINAVFGQDLAKTGIGAPVTQHVSLYKNKEDTLGLYDFKGSESFDELRAFVKDFKQIYLERMEEGDPIHGVWMCVKASDRRFDDNQRQLVEELAALDVPVVLVVTQTPWKAGSGYAPDAGLFLEHLKGLSLPIVTREAVPVAAISDSFAGTEAFGLDRLVQLSLEAAPKGAEAALAAAQRVDLAAKRSVAQSTVVAATAAATIVGASPIPMSDALVLAPIQLGVMRTVASIYGITLSQQAATTAATQLAVSAVGRAAATGLLKLIPGAGSVISAAVAGSITAALGYSWLRLCEAHFKGTLDIFEMLETDELVKMLLVQVTKFLEERQPAQ